MKVKPILTEFYRRRSVRLTTLYLCAVAFCFYATFHQTKRNDRYVEKQHERVEKAMEDEMPHPLRILRFWEHRGEVMALNLAGESGAQTFWVVSELIDPTLSMNYFTWPKELYMSVETQQELMFDYLSNVKRTHEHVPPEKFDKVLIIDKYQARIKDEWN